MSECANEDNNCDNDDKNTNNNIDSNSRSNSNSNNNIVHLRGLPREMSIADGVQTVTQLCSEYGQVEECFLIKRKGQALVRMNTDEEARALLRATLCVRNKVVSAQLSTRSKPLFDVDKSRSDKIEENKSSALTIHTANLISSSQPPHHVFTVWPCPAHASFVSGDCVVVKIKKKYHLAVVCAVQLTTVDVLLQPDFCTTTLASSSPSSIGAHLCTSSATAASQCSSISSCYQSPPRPSNYHTHASASPSSLATVRLASVLRWARSPSSALFPALFSSVSAVTSSSLSDSFSSNLNFTSSTTNEIFTPSAFTFRPSCPVWVCQETTHFHHLARTQVNDQDVALEIGCDFGACCAILVQKCRAVIGVDKEAEHVKLAKQRVAGVHFLTLDVLFDTDSFIRHIQEVERKAGASVSVVFIDINGNRDLRPVCSVIHDVSS